MGAARHLEIDGILGHDSTLVQDFETFFLALPLNSESPYHWVVGNDPGLSCLGKIGAGSGSEVFKVSPCCV